METLNQMQKRIQAFSIHSLYCREDGSFETNPNLIHKYCETYGSRLHIGENYASKQSGQKRRRSLLYVHGL